MQVWANCFAMCGLLKRDGKVYTEIVPDAQKDTLQAIIRGKVSIESVIYSDNWRGYNGLVDVGYDKHFRVNHSQNEFANGKNHINGIESFLQVWVPFGHEVMLKLG